MKPKLLTFICVFFVLVLTIMGIPGCKTLFSPGAEYIEIKANPATLELSKQTSTTITVRIFDPGSDYPSIRADIHSNPILPREPDRRRHAKNCHYTRPCHEPGNQQRLHRGSPDHSKVGAKNFSPLNNKNMR